MTDVPAPTGGVPQWDALLERWEDNTFDVLMRYLDRQKAVIVARLSGAKTRKAVLEKGRPLEVKQVVDVARWRRELEDDLTGAFRAIFLAVAADVMGRLDETLDRSDWAITAEVAAMVRVATETEGFEQRIVRRLERARDSIRRQGDLDRLVDELAEEYALGAASFARGVAGSTTVGAVNGATHVAVMQVSGGRPGTKTWMSVGDLKVRLSHIEAHGQEVPAGHTFYVGGAQARFPGDPALPPEERINCRCTVRYAVREREPDLTEAAGAGLARVLGLR